MTSADPFVLGIGKSEGSANGFPLKFLSTLQAALKEMMARQPLSDPSLDSSRVPL